MSSPRLDANGPATIKPGMPLSDVARDIAGLFREAGIASPALDARVLVCHACGVSHEQLVANPEQRLSDVAARDLERAVARRMQREPVSRIVGTREFRGLEFAIDPDTLDPRPDTETLVEAALSVIAETTHGKPPKILDIGTGSGCVLVSLLHALPDATGVGTDISLEAIEIARRNAEANGVADRAHFARTRWADDVSGPFDLVVSNPPYIPSGRIDALEPEVARFDPRLALDGGGDGLQAYREIVSGLEPVLTTGGWILFEVGDGQDRDVQTMLESGAPPVTFGPIRHWTDLSGRVRCVGAIRSPRSV